MVRMRKIKIKIIINWKVKWWLREENLDNEAVKKNWKKRVYG